MYSSFPADKRPTGFARYGHDYETQARRFLELVEGQIDSPGSLTMGAYFEDDFTVTLDDKNPKNTLLRFGRIRREVKMSELIVRRHEWWER